MKSGCSALTHAGSHVSGSFATTSCHQKSRPALIGTAEPVRFHTNTDLMPSQSPIASASSTTGFSAISRPPRNWPSAVMTATAPASMIRS